MVAVSVFFDDVYISIVLSIVYINLSIVFIGNI